MRAFSIDVIGMWLESECLVFIHGAPEVKFYRVTKAGHNDLCHVAMKLSDDEWVWVGKPSEPCTIDHLREACRIIYRARWPEPERKAINDMTVEECVDAAWDAGFGSLAVYERRTGNFDFNWVCFCGDEKRFSFSPQEAARFVLRAVAKNYGVYDASTDTIKGAAK